MPFFTFFVLFGCFLPYFSYLMQPISHSKCKGFATVAFTLRIYVFYSNRSDLLLFPTDKGQIFLVRTQQAQSGEQGVRGHTGGQADRHGKGVAAGGAVFLAGQAVDIKVGFGKGIFQGTSDGVAVFIRSEQLIEQLRFHSLDAQRSFGGGSGLALFLALDLGDIELDEAVLGHGAGDVRADELTRAVAVGQDDDGAFGRQCANEGERFLMVEDAEAVGGNDLAVHDARKALFIIAALDDDGIWNIEFIGHGGGLL